MAKPQLRHILTFALIMLGLSFLYAADGKFTVVIDAGHGAHDPGTVGSFAKEKDINLAVAKKVGEKIKDSHKDVNVVYTREKDVFVPVIDRAKKANRINADLFISIHVNSAPRKSKTRKTTNGAEVYVLGLDHSEDNLNVVKRENEVTTLEKDYTETYRKFDPNSIESKIAFEIYQSHNMECSIRLADEILNELVTTAGRANRGVRQGNIYVVWATQMPSVLIELDFISNPKAEKFMASKAGQEKLSQAIYNGFSSYYSYITGSTQKNSDVQQPEEPSLVPYEAPETEQQESDQSTVGETEYRIQILASESKIKNGSREFKEEKNIGEYKEKGLYKYTVGSFKTQSEAQRQLNKIKKKFPSAFIIKMKDGQRQY